MDRLSRAHHVHYAVFAAAIVVTVIVARTAWVVTYNFALRIVNRVLGGRAPQSLTPPPFKATILVAWCGMRGIVTLAAALALPDGSGVLPAFPYRDLIVLTAFAVVLGTLVIQGFTLRMLLMKLQLDDDGAPLENEIRAARVEMVRASLASVDPRESDATEAVRREYADLLKHVDGELSEEELRAEVALRAAARVAARAKLDALRASGAIGEAAFLQLEAELDLYELETDMRGRW